MYNPLLPSLSKLKDAEIEAKISEIIKKYQMASRLGYVDACQQLATSLDIYRAEQQVRYSKATYTPKKEDGKNLDDLISVD